MHQPRVPRSLPVLILALALAGCSASPDDDDVASLTGADPAQDAAAPVDLAGEFLRCLTDEGVDAYLDDDGFLVFGSPTDDLSESGSMMTSTEDGELTSFSVDGVDLTEPMRVCQERVPGYDPFAIDPDAPELAAMQESALAWVACAREHGFTGIEDPVNGTVVFPDHLSATTAAALLEACPLADYEIGGFGFTGEPDPEVLALLDRQ